MSRLDTLLEAARFIELQERRLQAEIESRHDARSQPHRNLLNRQVWLPGAHEAGEVSGGRAARCTAPRSAAARMRRSLPPRPRSSPSHPPPSVAGGGGTHDTYVFLLAAHQIRSPPSLPLCGDRNVEVTRTYPHSIRKLNGVANNTRSGASRSPPTSAPFDSVAMFHSPYSPASRFTDSARRPTKLLGHVTVLVPVFHQPPSLLAFCRRAAYGGAPLRPRFASGRSVQRYVKR
ncbi:hypothetical protein RR46_11720 [Papilio xuthus]|uniref:Uncharacterized protein n=1 Tax=Papilio xuthus TaxID=66420 RepID=A0A194PRR9_PAPXU|nr:hypothetical protein RR46_11720 [Papilio xuthus]